MTALVEAPALCASELEHVREELSESGRWDKIITHFGFVYASKQPEKLLEVALELRRRGHKVRTMLVGDFFDHRSDRRDYFLSRVKELGLEGCVELRGYVEDEAEMANLVAASDAVLALYDDGVSVRRTSFWYVGQLGTAIITTRPRDTNEFNGMAEVLDSPQVFFVPECGCCEHIADCIEALPEYEPLRYSPIISPEWESIASRHSAVYGTLGGPTKGVLGRAVRHWRARGCQCQEEPSGADDDELHCRPGNGQ